MGFYMWMTTLYGISGNERASGIGNFKGTGSTWDIAFRHVRQFRVATAQASISRNRERRPTGLCQSAKGGIMLESDLSKIQGFHTLAQTTALGHHNASLHQCRGDRVLRCDHRFAQFSSNRNQVEDGSGASRHNAWDSHRIKLRFTRLCAGAIIALKSRDGRCDNLRLGIEVVLFLDHQEDNRRVMNKANVCLR